MEVVIYFPKCYLKSKNIKSGEEYEEKMSTGDHLINRVYCKLCKQEIGWHY